MKRELLVGCGNKRDKRIVLTGDTAEWSSLTTLDHDPDCDPDVLWNLNVLPLPFSDNEFDQIHAYEVLEHCGAQGDYVAFFALFSEFWRILKHGGVLAATVPSLKSEWLWADPGHVRAISQGSLVFLSQNQYKDQIGKTAMTDYRSVYKADFETVYAHDDMSAFYFVLKAIKGGSV